MKRSLKARPLTTALTTSSISLLSSNISATSFAFSSALSEVQKLTIDYFIIRTSFFPLPTAPTLAMGSATLKVSEPKPTGTETPPCAGCTLARQFTTIALSSGVALCTTQRYSGVILKFQPLLCPLMILRSSLPDRTAPQTRCYSGRRIPTSKAVLHANSSLRPVTSTTLIPASLRLSKVRLFLFINSSVYSSSIEIAWTVRQSIEAQSSIDS